MKQDAMTANSPSAPEIFASMLERLGTVINHTAESVSVGDQIFCNSLDAVERLGFLPRRLNGVNSGKESVSEAKDVPTAL